MNWIKTISTAALLLTTLGVFAQRLENKIDLRGQWKFRIGDKMEWSREHFNDNNWETIRVPNEWEDEGFNGYDGYAWYRNSFDGYKLRDEKDVYINLGYIDDADEVYINGVLIGLSGQFPPDFQTAYTANRIYYVPIEYINVNGTNTIAVRVYDTVHGGGIISGNIGIYVPSQFMSDALILEGLWKFQFGDKREWKEPDFDDSEWGHKMVPAYWSSKRYNIKEFYSSKWGDLNYGWYRKEFKVPGKFRGKELSIVLGRIDDFDQVFINGQLVGETNDGRGFGSSESYRRKRIYEIPSDFLDDSDWNVIAIRVTDMGGDAGIYEGPIGLVESNSVGDFLDWAWFKKR